MSQPLWTSLFGYKFVAAFTLVLNHIWYLCQRHWCTDWNPFNLSSQQTKQKTRPLSEHPLSFWKPLDHFEYLLIPFWLKCSTWKPQVGLTKLLKFSLECYRTHSEWYSGEMWPRLLILALAKWLMLLTVQPGRLGVVDDWREIQAFSCSVSIPFTFVS